MTRPRGERFWCNNNGAGRHGISIVGSCWQRAIIESNVDNSCGCTGDTAVPKAFFKDDIMAFDSRTQSLIPKLTCATPKIADQGVFD